MALDPIAKTAINTLQADATLGRTALDVEMDRMNKIRDEDRPNHQIKALGEAKDFASRLILKLEELELMDPDKVLVATRGRIK